MFVYSFIFRRLPFALPGFFDLFIGQSLKFDGTLENISQNHFALWQFNLWTSFETGFWCETHRCRRTQSAVLIELNANAQTETIPTPQIPTRLCIC